MRKRIEITAAVSVLVTLCTIARAQVDAGIPAVTDAGTTGDATLSPAAPPVPVQVPTEGPQPPPPEVTAFSDTQAVSGLVEPRDVPESRARRLARAALLPVRGLWFLIWSPLRLSLWAFDRFAVKSRLRQIFFSEDGRLGLFPIATYKTGFGPGVGARFILRDVLGDSSRLKAEASYGGEVFQAYRLQYGTGALLGDAVELAAIAGWETFPRNRFFGIGNHDEMAAGAMGIDPVAAAVDTRFYYDALTIESDIAIDLPEPLRVHVGGGYRRRSFELGVVEAGDLNTFEVYDPALLVGAMSGLSSAFVDWAVIVDTLEQPRFDLSKAVPSRGWYVVARVGYVEGLGNDSTVVTRWGVDVQRRFNVYAHDRIVVVRGWTEGVAGPLSQTSFLDLPRLGGSALLRGYPQDRFRDRRAGLVSAEYQWGVDRNASAFLFVDVGRVWRNFDDLRDGKLRAGFGGGAQIHSMKNFMARVMVASSIDGGLFLLFGLDPLFERRKEQR